MSVVSQATGGARIYLDQGNFGEQSISNFLAIAREVGVGAIDLHPRLTGEPIDRVVDAVAASGMPVACVSPLPTWFPEWVEFGDFSPETYQLLEVAGSLGTRVGAPSPLWCPSQERCPSVHVVGSAYAALCEAAESVGAAVALEPVGLSVRFPGKIGVIQDLAAAREVVESHDLPVLLIADTYCLASGDDVLVTEWSAVDTCILQFADKQIGHPPRLLPGTGDLPLKSWFAGAVDRRPDSVVGIEVFPMAPPADPLLLARQLVAMASRLIGAA